MDFTGSIKFWGKVLVDFVHSIKWCLMCNNKCHTPRCKNSKAPGNKICHSCISKKFRANNPEMACYKALKCNAKRRGKDFKLSFNQFKIFCRKTDYLAGKGRSKESFTIDRINNDKGYTMGNIRLLSKTENCSKGSKVLQYDYATRYATVMERLPSTYIPNDQYAF